MTRRHIGVDPGLTGAIAYIQNGNLEWVIDMPVANGAVVVPLLNDIYTTGVIPEGPYTSDPAAIEKVASMPGQGVASTFKFGQAYGTVLGALWANGHPIIHAPPGQWKKHFRLTGKPKDAARLLALEKWPHMADDFRRKKDVGRADAALIALWAQETS